VSAPLTTVHLMRHGEVDNPTGVLYGRLPGFVLSPLGRQMAERVAQFLTGHDITYVVASPLERAQETAAPVAAAHGLPVHSDERLLEAGNAFEGRVLGGPRQIAHPRHWWQLRNPFTPSWGEPYFLQVRRMMAAVHDARDAALGHEAVCVSHQLPIWTLRGHLEGRRLWHDPRRRQCTLASLTSVTFAGDAVAAVSYVEPARDLLPGPTRWQSPSEESATGTGGTELR
jgi:broad specificity phosphatase PhoE